MRVCVCGGVRVFLRVCCVYARVRVGARGAFVRVRTFVHMHVCVCVCMRV